MNNNHVIPGIMTPMRSPCLVIIKHVVELNV